MSKGELITAVASQLPGITKKTTGEVLSKAFETIVETVKGGEEVNIMGFATFKSEFVEDRQGVNPATGDKITIPAHNKLKIKASQVFKDTVSGKKK